MYTRNSSESENTHRISPAGSVLSQGNLKNEIVSLVEHSQHYINTLKVPHQHVINSIDIKTNFNVPVFVLHAKGSFYVPITIDYKTLLPYLQNYNLMEVFPNLVLHPVTINVNFQPNFDLKAHNYKSENNWH